MNRTIGIVILLLVVLGVAIYINAQRQEGSQWQDGTYVGRSSPDERGYFGEIELKVADGKITEAEYEEMDQQGNRKDENYPYPLGPQSHDEYEDRLVETQNVDEVDSISGATQTHDRFVEAARDALRKAEQGDQSRPPAIEAPRPPMPTEEDNGESAGEEHNGEMGRIRPGQKRMTMATMVRSSLSFEMLVLQKSVMTRRIRTARPKVKTIHTHLGLKVKTGLRNSC